MLTDQRRTPLLACLVYVQSTRSVYQNTKKLNRFSAAGHNNEVSALRVFSATSISSDCFVAYSVYTILFKKKL